MALKRSGATLGVARWPHPTNFEGGVRLGRIVHEDNNPNVSGVPIEPQRLWATTATPVASLDGMAVAIPSLAADPHRSSGLFLFLAHGRQRARKRNVFFQKNHRKAGRTK